MSVFTPFPTQLDAHIAINERTNPIIQMDEPSRNERAYVLFRSNELTHSYYFPKK